MPSPSYSLAFSLMSIMMFTLYFIFSYVNYDRRFNAKYDIRNTFPYEFNYKGRFKDNLFGNIFLVLSSICGIISFISFDNTHTGFMTFTLISGILTCVCFILSSFVPLKELRFHIFISVLLLISAFMLSASITISGFQLNNDPVINKTLPIISIVIGAIGSIIMFGVIMNPRLTFFSKMISSTDKDGKVTYTRPKYFPLAFSEWISLFVMLFEQIGIILLSFAIHSI